jgi:2,4'-dihydroxyacetophenone dioxygenase
MTQPLLPDFARAAASILGYLPAVPGSLSTPWVPGSALQSCKPLRFFPDGRGWVELMRMEPGGLMPLHRHHGEVHVFNLSGRRELCSGEVMGPGDYVYEPPGNTDWWRVVGDEPMIALVIATGAVDDLDPDGAVTTTACAHTRLRAYEEFCRSHGLPILDLVR